MSNVGGDAISNTSPIHLRHGAQATDSPSTSYDDAADDFSHLHGVRFTRSVPAIGHTRSAHLVDEVRGNIKIYYTVTYRHGALVGDANVNVAHIDSESAPDGQVITADGAGNSAWEAAAGGASLSDDAPLDVGTADAGTGTESSRDDHVHGGDGP